MLVNNADIHSLTIDLLMWQRYKTFAAHGGQSKNERQ
jgi:hypothetical protein